MSNIDKRTQKELYAKVEQQAHSLRGNPREYQTVTGMCPVNVIEMQAQKIQALLDELEAAEKRIAELEARDQPKFVQCWSCKHDIEVLAIADCDGCCPRCAAPIDLDDEPYAGIGIKGE